MIELLDVSQPSTFSFVTHGFFNDKGGHAEAGAYLGNSTRMMSLRAFGAAPCFVQQLASEALPSSKEPFFLVASNRPQKSATLSNNDATRLAAQRLHVSLPVCFFQMSRRHGKLYAAIVARCAAT